MTKFLKILVALNIYHILLFAHCQIPCGIYSDSEQILKIEEDLATIEKAMKKVRELSSNSDPQSFNQKVRWITAKESHAQNIQDIVSRYFMAQRIKEDSKNYSKKIKALHSLLISTMKCKQSLELVNVINSRMHLKSFSKLYFGKEELEHLDQHLQ